MPPHHPKHAPPKPPPHAPIPPTAIRAVLSPERLEPLFRSFLPDDADRAFVMRCILEQGPIHHRGASFALLSLVAELLVRTGGMPDKPVTGQTVAVPLRLPPHLAAERGEDETYPLQMALAPLEILAPQGGAALAALADCLLDGPPHHALANALIVSALGVLLERSSARPSDGTGAGGSP